MLNNFLNIKHTTLLLNLRLRARQSTMWIRNLKSENPPTPKLTMVEVKRCYMERLDLTAGYQARPRNREYLLKYTPKSGDLPPRSMQDSFTAARIPLSEDVKLQDRYASTMGRLRLGRLIEDMDFFAAWVCLQHLHLPNLPENVPMPYTFVTILADKILTHKHITNVKNDVRISGHVSWVGRSSLEVVIWLEQMGESNKVKPITRALFLMAARNAINTTAVPVNPINPMTDEERKILAGGEDRKKKRLEIQEKSIFSVVPNEKEQMLIFDKHQRTKSKESIMWNKRILPRNGRWMSEWSTITNIAPFPENRNSQYTVFGGFLMRQMIQNSFICAYFYFAEKPKTICLFDINFKAPVPVTSYIRLTSYVLYTEGDFALLLTVADILCALSGKQITSNSQYILYRSEKEICEIFPQTYEESLWYIQGTRMFRNAMEHIEQAKK